MPRRLLLAAAVLVVAAAPAAAAPRPPVDAPILLPGDAAASRVAADRSTWLVGARSGDLSRRIGTRHGARTVVASPGPLFLVPRERARSLAAALKARGLLTFAEPNRLSLRSQAPAPDPLSADAGWRDFVVDPATVPPPVTTSSPLLALVDSQVDVTHPEFVGGNVSTVGGRSVTDSHGTATAAVAGAPKNNVGILGVWPGMRVLNVPLPERITCADSVSGISRAVSRGARVINMSYVSTSPCFAEYVQVQKAFAKGVLPVAASGNEFVSGNPLTFPASLPHVLTIAAIGPDLRATFFSSSSAAIDLSAPGENILTAVPPVFDEDGNPDGYQRLAGTSFAAPMVAAAATWVRAARPRLSVDQLFQVVRLSARDLQTEGWDRDTGFGLVSVDRALTTSPPARDPQEPNDNMVWVDGRGLGKRASFVFTGRRTRTLTALLDQFEDPADVYRIRVPGRSVIRATIKPRFGNPDLAAFDGRARSLADTRRLIAQSTRTGRASDTVALRNSSRRALNGYLVAYIEPDTPGLDAAYRLTIKRSRGR